MERLSYRTISKMINFYHEKSYQLLAVGSSRSFPDWHSCPPPSCSLPLSEYQMHPKLTSLLHIYRRFPSSGDLEWALAAKYPQPTEEWKFNLLSPSKTPHSPAPPLLMVALLPFYSSSSLSALLHLKVRCFVGRGKQFLHLLLPCR